MKKCWDKWSSPKFPPLGLSFLRIFLVDVGTVYQFCRTQHPLVIQNLWIKSHIKYLMIYVTHVRYLVVLYFILKEKKGSGKHSFFYSLTKCLTEIEYPPKFRHHLDWRHWVQPFHEKITATVEPYHFEPVRVPEVIKASNDDIDASERLGSLHWSIVIVVNSEKLQKSASEFLNSSNWKTGLQNLFHDFCSFLPFKYACNRALSSNLGH